MKQSPSSLAILGVTGRMGREVLHAALQDPLWKIAGGAASPSSCAVGSDLGELVGSPPIGIYVSKTAQQAIDGAEVVIDFSVVGAVKKNIESAVEARSALVIGTTGLSSEEQQYLEKNAQYIPLLYAANFSFGIKLLQEMATFLEEKLRETCYIELFETHHVQKKDQPSGTALALAQAMGGKVNIHSLRTGDVVGEHRIVFSSPAERLEIKHEALNRGAFAQGALRAARWLMAQPPGLYTLKNL